MPSAPTPADVHRMLKDAPSVEIEFETERKLVNFRANLYSINSQGSIRYRTARSGLKLTVTRTL